MLVLSSAAVIMDECSCGSASSGPESSTSVVIDSEGQTLSLLGKLRAPQPSDLTHKRRVDSLPLKRKRKLEGPKIPRKETSCNITYIGLQNNFV